MESKKNPKADLEKGRVLFFLIGLLISLLIVFILLNYDFSEPEKEEVNIEITGLEIQQCK
ncbi:MAG: hypothetical protein MJ211_02780 [Bacteroidales bacterium]|nr:hypothetical protein [Bacteroidales bacterium]